MRFAAGSKSLALSALMIIIIIAVVCLQIEEE